MLVDEGNFLGMKICIRKVPKSIREFIAPQQEG
jgi:hypothetical protein